MARTHMRNFRIYVSFYLKFFLKKAFINRFSNRFFFFLHQFHSNCIKWHYERNSHPSLSAGGTFWDYFWFVGAQKEPNVAFANEKKKNVV